LKTLQLVCQQIDRSRPLALHCVQFLQSEEVRKCKDNHQDGQHEINSPRHEIIAPSVRFARLKSRIVSAMKNADTSIVLNKMVMLIDHASRQQAS